MCECAYMCVGLHAPLAGRTPPLLPSAASCHASPCADRGIDMCIEREL